MLRRTAAVWLVGAVCLVCGCAATGSTAGDNAKLDATGPASGQVLPAPADLQRGAADTAEGWRGLHGSGYLPDSRTHNLLELSILGGEFQPKRFGGAPNTFETTAYGIYHFSLPGYTGAPLVRFSQDGYSDRSEYGWDGTENVLWLGLSDFEANAWDWIWVNPAAFNNGECSLALASLGKYIDGGGNLYVAVAACGTEHWKFNLHWLVIGGNLPPFAVMLTDKASGPVPLTVKFEVITDHADLDGELAYFEWDFNGDSNWDSGSETAFEIQHTYYSPGEYECIVRITDDSGGSATDSRTITVTVG